MMNDRRIATLEADIQRIRAQLSEIPVRFPTPGSKGVGSEIQQFVFKSQQPNWIVCRTWDGLAEGANDVKVVKPWELRPYVFSGRTYSIDSVTRVLYTYPANDQRQLITQRFSGGVWTEQSRTTETVYPPWNLVTIGAERGLIYAFKPVGGTSEEDDDEEAIVWQDANVSARTWRATAAMGTSVIGGNIKTINADTLTVVLFGTTNEVTVAKQHLHRLSTTLDHGIQYSEQHIVNSARKATSVLDEAFQYEQIIPQFLSTTQHQEFPIVPSELGQVCVALDVGEVITGIAGVRYIDVSSRIWGRLP